MSASEQLIERNREAAIKRATERQYGALEVFIMINMAQNEEREHPFSKTPVEIICEFLDDQEA